MSKVALYTDDDERLDVPERESRGDLLAEYDPEDPESLSRAQLAIQQRFGLKSLPPLCSEPEPGFFTRLWRALVLWLRPNRSKGPEGQGAPS